jgi:hypothetical protein
MLTMPPAINLEKVKGTIEIWFNDNLTQEEMIKRLKAEFQIQVSPRTLRKRLSEWALVRRISVVETPELRARIAYLFCILGLNDSEMLRALKHDGHQIEHTSLSRIRRKQGLWRRLTVFDRAQLEDQLREAIKEELDNGTIEGYGKGLLYTYFRTSGFIATRYGSHHVQDYSCQLLILYKQINIQHCQGT